MTKRRKSKKGHNTDYLILEHRVMLTGISLESIAGRMNAVVDGSSQNDSAVVRDVANGMVEFELNNTTVQFARTEFERIRFLGRSGNDTFNNSTDIDSAIIGHSGNDQLVGGDGNNWIRGGDGFDSLSGGARNDLIRGGEGDDVILAGHRHDRIFGEGGDDEIRGQQGNDYIDGGTGSDLLISGSGDDRVIGHGGADQIYAGTGNDWVHGGSGDDRIMLEEGSDVAVYDNVFSGYQIGGNSQTLVVSAYIGFEGRDEVFGAENLRFSDGVQPAEPNANSLNEAERASLIWLNSVRSGEHVATLSSSNDLNEFARNWSLEMSITGFRHSSQTQRSHLLTGERTFTVENIAFSGDVTMSAEEAARTLHEIWINSSTHYANMISSRNTEVGIGLVQTTSGWYGTHLFSNG